MKIYKKFRTAEQQACVAAVPRIDAIDILKTYGLRSMAELETRLTEAEGLRRAINAMGLDPAKVSEHALSEVDQTCKLILFSAVDVNDQSLRERGMLAEASFPSWKRAYDSLKIQRS